MAQSVHLPGQFLSQRQLRVMMSPAPLVRKYISSGGESPETQETPDLGPVTHKQLFFNAVQTEFEDSSIGENVTD